MDYDIILTTVSTKEVDSFVFRDFERVKVIDEIVDRSGTYQIFEGTKNNIITFYFINFHFLLFFNDAFTNP